MSKFFWINIINGFFFHFFYTWCKQNDRISRQMRQKDGDRNIIGSISKAIKPREKQLCITSGDQRTGGR